MQIGLRQFSSETVDWFKRACAEGTATRTSLARELCRREQWFDYRGGPNEASARKLLPNLASALSVELPKAGEWRGDSHARPEVGYPDKVLDCGLAALGIVSLEPVPESERRNWESMIETHHPEGWRRAPGGQFRYWIDSSCHGVLGGVGFAAASCQLGPRDQYIGWSAEARLSNIGRAVCNQRFLVLPSVRVRELASRALRLATDRIAGDWEAKYGVRPALAYSFTSPGQSGLSYRAAKWFRCPEETSGRRSGECRSVWVKPLEEGWRERLCQEPRRPLGWSKSLQSGGDWATREFARSGHTDGRVRRRIAAMGEAWLESPGERLSAVFKRKAEWVAAFRILANERVAVDHVLEPHFEATVERCRPERLVLAVQGATTLNLGIPAADISGLGNPGGGKGGCEVLAHCGVAINSVGRPLGMFSMDAAFRRTPETGGARWVAGLERARELSEACPDSRVVTVCDRKGDFWELLSAAERGGAALLVRAGQAAKRRVARAGGGTEDLWDHVAKVEPLGTRSIEVSSCGGPNRGAALFAIRCLAVDLVPPVKVGGPPIRMVAVSAVETHPPRSVAREKSSLRWMLLTTEGEASIETALAALRWYELSQRINSFFRALKSGSRIGDRRLRGADELRKCLAFDAVAAFRACDLALLAREEPGHPVGD